MKKFTTILALALSMGVSGITSAEGVMWYGALKGGLKNTEEKGTSYHDDGSFIGIKGSVEVSESLDAVYRFEHELDTSDGELPEDGGRLSYVGLASGGHSVTAGKMYSAAYNHTGVLRDMGNSLSSGDTETRTEDTVSWAYAGSTVSAQADVVMDSEKMSADGKAQSIDGWSLGLTVKPADSVKVAMAHENVESNETMMYDTKTNHVSGEWASDSLAVALGYSQSKSDSKMKKTEKTSFLGLSGKLGELGWSAWNRKTDNPMMMAGEDEKEWGLGLSKSLGGSAKVYLEHKDVSNSDGMAGKDMEESVVALAVSF